MKISDATKARIKELCREREITYNKLAIMCGITQSSISNILNRPNNTVTVSTIKKICDGLEISIQEFFNSELFSNLEQETK